MQAAEKENEDLLTVKEVASIAKLHTETIYRLYREGKLKGKKIGDGSTSPIRFRRSVIEKYLGLVPD